jgi:hypothetical protein
MAGLQACATIETSDPDARLSGAAAELDRRRKGRAACPELPLRCVSSGYLADGCSCPATIPMAVATAAWQAELERSGKPRDRFFRFDWWDGVWLAYGLTDGRIRGVYCPEHSAEREQRLAGCDLLADPPVASLQLSA